MQRFTTRILAVGILACGLAISSAGQKTHRKLPTQKCEITIDRSPVVRGIRLGESYNEVMALFPRFRITEDPEEDEFGVSTDSLSPDTLMRPDSLQGIQAVHLRYVDRTVAGMRFVYETGIHWQSNLHFTAAIAEKLGLPVSGWTGKNPSFLDCSYFFVATAIDRSGPVVQIQRSDFDDMIAARKKILEEKKRATFKP